MPLTESSATTRQGFSALFGTDALPLSDNLQLQAKTLLGSLGRQARLELISRSIQIPPAICLYIDRHGKLQLLGRHPQAKQIRLWLHNSHYLAELFKEVELLFELQRCSEALPPLAGGSRFCIGLTSAGPVAYFETPSHHARNG
ncbi:MAG: hypothetical protein JO338_03170 [Aquitalea sp.]|nr:hypothetical protein [Burkholderiaceae bacterium]MBV8679428.1 hypothetical protein [Aquitalea sp.]